jgi:hypothetical protein
VRVKVSCWGLFVERRMEEYEFGIWIVLHFFLLEMSERD